MTTSLNSNLVGQLVSKYFNATEAAATFETANASILTMELPDDAVITDLFMYVDELDSGTSITLNINLRGYPVNLFGSALTTGQAGGSYHYASDAGGAINFAQFSIAHFVPDILTTYGSSPPILELSVGTPAGASNGQASKVLLSATYFRATASDAWVNS